MGGDPNHLSTVMILQVHILIVWTEKKGWKICFAFLDSVSHTLDTWDKFLVANFLWEMGQKPQSGFLWRWLIGYPSKKPVKSRQILGKI